MTLNGAIKQLHELRCVEDIPIYYKPAIAEVINVLLMNVQEVRHGRWQVNEVNGYKDMTCLSCGWLFEYYDGLEEEWNYCPHCGAKMAECEAVLRWPRGEDETETGG